tara:strand:- start:566 stop:1567 length:1002 start_codon:yes stop_codon:yes gene_type:complete
MAQIPGSIPITGKVAPTDTTDTFATHVDVFGEGGYMTVADQAEREAITTERRKQGMAVFQNDTNEMYILQDGVANSNWTLFSGGSGTPDMQDVFDNSTPDITAIDNTKKLSLAAGDVDILTNDGNGGDGIILLEATHAEAPNHPIFLELDSGPRVTTLSTRNLDVEISSPGNVKVGDVLMVDSVVNSDYGRLNYKPGVQSKKVTLTSAQILNLHNTPVELIPAAGGSTFIVVLSIYSFLDFNTTPYTGQQGSDIKVRYGDGTIQTNFSTLLSQSSLGASQDTFRALSGFFSFTSNPPLQAWLPNTNVQVYSDAANTNGDSPITFYVTYMIKNL